MKTLTHCLIVAAVVTIAAPAVAAPRDGRAYSGLTADQLYTAAQRERASQQPLWAPDLNDRNAVY